MTFSKHTLSGTVGKNLMTMEFPLDQELEGGAQELLLRLRDTKLTDDLLLEEFYDKVIENYEFCGKLLYYIDSCCIRCAREIFR